MIYFYHQFVNFNENVKRLVNNLVSIRDWFSLIFEQFLLYKKCVPFDYWLLAIFLFLYLLKFYFLKPRCIIDDILLYHYGLNIKNPNPNWNLGEIPKIQLGFFYF